MAPVFTRNKAKTATIGQVISNNSGAIILGTMINYDKINIQPILIENTCNGLQNVTAMGE